MEQVYQAIDVINSVVDACFVINLDKDIVRWRETSRYLESYGLENIERFPGTLEEYGHLGALLSHTDAHKKIKDLGISAALVLEDDVRLHLNMEEKRLCKWDNIIAQLKSINIEKRSIYYLGGRQKAENSRVLLPGSAHGAYAYIITKSATIRSCNIHNFNIRKLQSYVATHGAEAAYTAKWRYTDKFHIDNWMSSWKTNYRLSTPLFTHCTEYDSNTKPGKTYGEYQNTKKAFLEGQSQPDNF